MQDAKGRGIKPAMTFADKLRELRERATKGPLSVEDFNADDVQRPNRLEGPVVVYSDDDCDTHPVADFSCNHTCRDAATAKSNAALFAFLVNHAAEIEALVRMADIYAHTTPCSDPDCCAAAIRHEAARLETLHALSALNKESA